MSRVVFFRAELGAEDPFWTEGGELLRCEELGVPVELCRELRIWVDGHWGLDDDTPEATAWDEQGRRFFDLLRTQLSPGCELVWDND